MFPIGDLENIRTTRPYVTYGLIGLNLLVFFYMLSLGGSVLFSDSCDVTAFVSKFGVIPSELFNGENYTQFRCPVQEGRFTRFEAVDIASPIPTWGTAFTSMFVHGGWLHIIGNMLYLWVFGDNIEARFGHLKFLLFYLAAGLAAVWAQVIINTNSEIPMVGASGAVAGVLGAYLVLFPQNRINTVVIFFLITVIQLPALFVLGFWFILQLFSGIGSLGVLEGGVAYWAHIGGFVLGMLVAVIYRLIRREPILQTPRRRRNPWDRFP
ncbi:MAG: rhomboid family intramembrane serine protease [SAR202 cluster bacterium]|nr:rhomboid family intramembrane serine protease [SAR202 cluster bacterium]